MRTVARRGPRAWEVAAFAVLLAVAGLVGLALLWAGDMPHRAVMAAQPRGLVFSSTAGGGAIPVSSADASELHAGWVGYVTGRTAEQPAAGRPWFTADERGHMADVRSVFISAQWAALAAFALLVLLARRSFTRGELADLARAGGLGAVAGILGLGLVAALAFDAAFLFFHQVFFPQGNFLFPPDSNLLRLYPGTYWYVLTIGIALTFLVVAGGIAIVAHLALRASTARSAIVSPR